MTAHQQVKDLLDFIDKSPSPYHAVKSIEDQLTRFNFVQLDERQKWGGKVRRALLRYP